jgi:hypothetical protein
MRSSPAWSPGNTRTSTGSFLARSFRCVWTKRTSSGLRHSRHGGESSPGEPFYLHAPQGDLTIDIGVCDEVEGEPYFDVYRLEFPFFPDRSDEDLAPVVEPLEEVE